MLKVSGKYRNVQNLSQGLKGEINNYRNQIAMIKDDTLNLKNILINEQNYINMISKEIQKANKAISDKKKEIENILPAINLLKNHIISVKQKLGKFNLKKTNNYNSLNYIDNHI